MLRRLFLVGLLSGCSAFLDGGSESDPNGANGAVAVSGIDVGPLALDESGLYMLSNDVVVRINPDTGDVRSLVSASGATELALNSSRVYWSEPGELGLYSADKLDGTNRTVRFHHPNETGRFIGISVTDVEASFFDTTTGMVFRGDIDSPQYADFGASESASDTLMIGTLTVWNGVDGLTIHDVGGSTEVLPIDLGSVNRLAADGATVFATADDGVVRHPTGTSVIEPIAEGQANPGDVAVVEGVVVWINRDEGTVCYTDGGGGAGEVVALEGLEIGDHSMVANASGVYVSEVSSQTLWRFPAPASVLE